MTNNYTSKTTVPITLEGLRAYLDVAKKNGTVDAWAELALDWGKAAADQVLLLEKTLHQSHNDKEVYFYEREFYPLSNFSAFRLFWTNRWFDTSEHAYHWEKFIDAAPHVAAKIMSANSAHEAFKIAEVHKEDRRPDWDTVKVLIMKGILEAKTMQHEYVERKLMETGMRRLVENSWRDSYWGWGPDKKGTNMLGFLWMEIREGIANGRYPWARYTPTS